jgi:hypothetical protein
MLGTESLRAIVRSVVTSAVDEFVVSYAIEIAHIVVTRSATSPICLRPSSLLSLSRWR